MLKCVKFPEQIRTEYPHINLQLEPRCAMISGPKHDVADVTLRIHDAILAVKDSLTVEDKVSEHVCSILKTSTIQAHLTAIFEKKGVAPILDVKTRDVYVYARNKEESYTALQLILAEIIEETINIEPDSKTVTHKTDWVTKVQYYRVKNAQIEVTRDEGSVIIVGQKDTVNEAKHDIQAFLSNQTTKTTEMVIDPVKIKVLQHAFQNEISKLEAAESALFARIVFHDDKRGCKISGNEATVQKIEKELLSYIKQMKKQEHVVNDVGMRRYFAGKSGEGDIVYMEKTYQVGIESITTVSAPHKNPVKGDEFRTYMY